MLKELCYVTGNEGKFAEVRAFFARHVPELNITQAPLEIDELQNPDMRVVALDKAQKAWQQLQKPLLIDDTGFYFDAYNNFPGTFTKHLYQGIGFEGIFKLIDKNRGAMMQTCLVYIDGNESYQLFESKIHGTILTKPQGIAPKGLYSFAYFQPDGCDKTYGQLNGTPEAEHYLTRQIALKQFLAWANKKI